MQIPSLYPRLLLVLVSLVIGLTAQTPPLKKDVSMIFAEICSNCHGKNLEGGQAPSMLDDQWSSGNGDDASIARIISEGSLEKGMPAFHTLMNEGDIRAMVIFIREQRAKYSRKRETQQIPEGVVTTAEHAYRIETIATGLKIT